MKTKIELKTELRARVTEKVNNTRERLALKRIPFATRTPDQHRHMLGRWSDGRVLKEEIRHVGLAYAFVRGRRYWVTERHTEDGPSAVSIAFYADCTAEEIEAWLAEKPSPEEAEGWLRHVEDTTERWRAARVARRAARSAA